MKDILEEFLASHSVDAFVVSYNDYESLFHAFDSGEVEVLAAEREWISENNSLRFGYLDHYLPYSATDESGNVTGLVKELVPRMLSELGLTGITLSFQGYESYADMIADIRSEKIDACFPVGGGLYYSEESGIYQSAPVASASTELICKDRYDDEDTGTFAANENNRMQYYRGKTGGCGCPEERLSGIS